MVDSGKCQRFNYYDDKKNLAHYNKVHFVSIYATVSLSIYTLNKRDIQMFTISIYAY